MKRRHVRNPYDADFRRERRILLANQPLCVHCGQERATIADHQPPLALHDHVKGSKCCVLVPSCRVCSFAQGGDVAHSVDLPEPVAPRREWEGFGPDDPVWRVPWLEPLLDVPADAVWPRLMTVPHPQAVG